MLRRPTTQRLRTTLHRHLRGALAGASAASAFWLTPVSTAQVPLPPRGFLHVLLEPIPQCVYGIGYEQPWRIELDGPEGFAGRAFTSGVFLGPNSLSVSLYDRDAPPGDYRVRIGRCPNLREQPLESVACRQVEWFKELDLGRIEPQGLAAPHVVKLPPLVARCLSVPARSPR